MSSIYKLSRNAKTALAVRRRIQPGCASDYIQHAKTVLSVADKVVLWCRVSSCAQNWNGNLQDQENNLRQVASKLGVEVVDVIRRVGSGHDSFWIRTAVFAAEKHGAKFILAESVDRFVRHPFYHSSKDPNAQPRKTDLQFLRQDSAEVILTTQLHPDSTPAEIRSYQRRRGQSYKNNKGGRPTKKKPAGKDRRLKYLPAVLTLSEQGLSCRSIAESINNMLDADEKSICAKTVHNWQKSSV